MSLKSHQGLKFGVFALWTILVVFQASVMELIDDEAYYWVYSQNLEWGHFHQPPMVAFFIKLGWIIFQNELGVRLFFILIHLLTLLLIDRMIEEEDDVLLIVLIGSLLLMHVAGFWAVPDIPYLFFTTSLLFIYKKYLTTDSLILALLLAINLACLMYSKYHGIIIIISILLANPKLFKRRSYYLAGVISLLLYIPHLWWQYQNEFISFQYHLFERSRIGFQFDYPLLFLGGLLLSTGPILGLLLLVPTLKFKPQTDFYRTLKYLFLGLIIFFGLMSFRSRIEANWLIAASVPMLIISHKLLQQNDKLRKWVYYSFPISLLIAVAVRIILTFDIMPADDNLSMKLKEFHGNKAWVSAIEEKAGDLPVVFYGSYQKPSKYLFYSKKKKASGIAHVLASPNQYQFYNFEKDFQFKKVFNVFGYPYQGLDTLVTKNRTFYTKTVEAYCSFATAMIDVDLNTVEWKAGQEVELPIKIIDGNEYDFTCKNSTQSYITYIFFQKGREVVSKKTNVKASDVAFAEDYFPLPISLPGKPGEYKLNISIWTDHLLPLHNTNRMSVSIVD